MARASRRWFVRALLLSAAGFAISGCGQKGPLFFPEDRLEKKKKEKTSEGDGKIPARA